ncbi:MAG: acyl carrier protein [Desulfarculus sp.]|nr:acyl carrier protein [Desulfarculus sp.]
MKPKLTDLLRQLFPAAVFDGQDPTLGVGSFAEWDSLGHFNFLLLVEETFGLQFSVDEITELKTLAQIRENLAARGVEA